MCIAICSKPNTKVSDEALRKSFSNNPDGCGFSYVRTDSTGRKKVIIKKTMDFDVFLHQYHRAQRTNPESFFLIHFRIATHGTVDKFNCHPFRINNDMSFIHNGVIGGVGNDKLMSDTQLFNEKVLKKLPKDFTKHDCFTVLIEKFITGSKLITLSIDNEVMIYNEGSGHWKEDVWYSNYSYSYGSRAVVYNYKDYGKKKGGVVVFTPSSYFCDGCGVRHNEYDCSFFISNLEPLCYCKDCVGVAYANKMVQKSDKITRNKYDVASSMLSKCDSYGDEYEYDNGRYIMG